jgi:hypothetical protein
VVKPANPRICRFFAFKAVFNFIKTLKSFVAESWHMEFLKIEFWED